MAAEQTTIAVSKPVHKELSHRKIENEYRTFENMLISEILENGD